MNILGISGQDRDAAAALVCNGIAVAAIEEEKLARIRHIGMTYAGGLPVRAIEFCLKQAGLNYDDIDFVGYYLEPNKLFSRSVAFGGRYLLTDPRPSTLQAFAQLVVDSLDNRRERLYTRRLCLDRLNNAGRFVFVDHQLAHAAAAFYSSGFDRAAILVSDNQGDMTSVAHLEGSSNGLRKLREARYPHSLGMVYNAVTAYLGFDASADQHKTMWMAASGNNRFSAVFKDLVQVNKNGMPVVDLRFVDGFSKDTPRLSQRFAEAVGARIRKADEPLTQIHCDIAASLQTHIEDTICEIAAALGRQTGHKNLCISGGVALNSLAVAALERRSGFERLFAHPAPGNAGCSVGAALYIWHDLLGHRERSHRIRHVFTGPVFNEDQIKSVLDNCKIDYAYYPTEERLIAEVARLLSQGRILGWFRGAMEFGPRTLGARSILASPLSELMRDNLNAYVKHREEFRPFSAAVPDQNASEFFEMSEMTDFLQTVCRLKDGASKRIPAAAFGEDLARVHTVNRETNPAFWKLLVKFGEVTGVPVLLNTSFNLFGEPVVSNPREAVRGFYCSGIDCLAIGNFLIKK